MAELKVMSGEEKIALFMDNLPAHRSEKAREEMVRLGFRAILNIPYIPKYNPIEFTFSKVKERFRRLRARKLAGLSQDSHRSMIEQAFKSLRKKDIVNCINHV